MKDKEEIGKCQILEVIRETQLNVIVGSLTGSWNRKMTLWKKTGEHLKNL